MITKDDWYTSVPQSMESERISQMLQTIGDPRITRIVHDGDNKNFKIIRDAGIVKELLLDINHAIKENSKNLFLNVIFLVNMQIL